MSNDSRRQKQLGHEIQQQLARLFIKENLSIVNGVLVTITEVRVTPDLLIAKIYLSFLNASNPSEILTYFNHRRPEIRHWLGNKMKNLRRIPNLEFFNDTSTDKAYKLENLLQQLTKANK